MRNETCGRYDDLLFLWTVNEHVHARATMSGGELKITLHVKAGDT